MKKMILVGRSECGKTTLKQALKGGTLEYHKTQYIYHTDVVIDTPGEYAQTRGLGRALALYSFETQVIALLLSSIEPSIRPTLLRWRHDLSLVSLPRSISPREMWSGRITG